MDKWLTMGGVSTATGTPMYGPATGIGYDPLQQWQRSIQQQMAASELAKMINYPTLNDMIRSRMRWSNANGSFSYLHAHSEKERVFIFGVINGEPVMLEDDAGLFPSDQLVTQLRLLENK